MREPGDARARSAERVALERRRHSLNSSKTRAGKAARDDRMFAPHSLPIVRNFGNGMPLVTLGAHVTAPAPEVGPGRCRAEWGWLNGMTVAEAAAASRSRVE